MKKTNHSIRAAFICFICAFMMLLVNTFPVTASSRIEVKKAIFEKADQAKKRADTHITRLFAPKTLKAAEANYDKATKAFIKEKTFKQINKHLNHAERLYHKAYAISFRAERLFSVMMEARKKAHTVRASRFDSENWSSAESIFERAITKIEKGKWEKAEGMAKEAETLFKQSEKKTVKISYLNAVWNKLEAVETMSEKNLAPKTYQKAKDLVKLAEDELDKKLYGNDKAKSLISKALIEATRAEELSRYIKDFLDSGKSYEDLVLEAKVRFPEEKSPANKKTPNDNTLDKDKPNKDKPNKDIIDKSQKSNLSAEKAAPSSSQSVL